VREHCSALICPAFSTIGDPDAIAQLVEKLKMDYNYTFLMAANVSTQFYSNTWLMFRQRNQLDAAQLLPMRTQPYRNDRIITVIRDMFFTGGANAYVHRFLHRFATYRGEDGVIRREVPVPMVALVATAVSALTVI